jgi:hypothetical protein
MQIRSRKRFGFTTRCLTRSTGTKPAKTLADWPLGTFGNETPNYVFPYTDYAVTHPTINRRLIANATVAKTIYLTPYPQDGSRMGIADPFGRLAAFPVTLDANGRTIAGPPRLCSTRTGSSGNGSIARILGSGCSLPKNSRLTKIRSRSISTISSSSLLSLRLNPRYGRSMDDQTALIFKSDRKRFVARYLQSQPLEIDDGISWPFMSSQSYDQQRAFSSNSAFNRGWYGGP